MSNVHPTSDQHTIRDVHRPDTASIERTENSLEPRFFVGIGASAGGLESLEAFFRNMEAGAGLSFVVIQHLSPAFKSMMGELLSRVSSMRIKLGEDGDVLERDTIYLIPAGKRMIIADGSLRLSDRDMSRGLALPVDDFLQSLARDKRHSAIAIILSGSGSDGSRGIVEIHENGGLVITESLETAKFDGMPSSAQATGVVHLASPPADIPKILAKYKGDPQALATEVAAQSEVVGDKLDSSEYSKVMRIIDLFRSSYQMDFSSYREATVTRRIQRRMDLIGIENHEAYLHHLKHRPEELHALYKDLLIGVTHFFRDPEVFEFLIHQEFPKLIARRAVEGAEIRAWVAGCATGEEAYTLAICLKESMRLCGKSVPFKLFATDVHRQAIDLGSRGIFNASVEQQLPSDVLERYFLPHSAGFQISPEIRQSIVFSPHNVLGDTPFTNLDFVSCRNLLIYFKTPAQTRAVSLFHYSLRVGGVLLLGTSESTGALAGEFEAIQERYRLFRKIRPVQLLRNLRIPMVSTQNIQQSTGGEDRPACVQPNFKGPLAQHLSSKDEVQELNLPLDESDQFPIDPEKVDAYTIDSSKQKILQLQTALKRSSDDLESTVEELQASNEELQATNEELLASNEQLQSANEELHSLNEELYSVNAELQRKIEELAELNQDMSHLLDNTSTATIFLDRNLRIRRFTSQVCQVFDLLHSDIGRSIETFSSKIKIENLVDHLKQVVDTGEPMEQEVSDVDGTSYLMKLLPYCVDGQVTGVVMMLVDVSSLETLRGRLRWMSAIVESTSDAIIGQDLSGVITSWNRGSELLYGYSAQEAVGGSIDRLVPVERKNEVLEYRNRVLRGELVSSVDTQRLRRDGSLVDVSLTVSPVFDSQGSVIGISKIARDITQRILLEQQIQQQGQQRERFLAVLSHELRNPLNAISSASAIIIDPQPKSEVKEAAAQVIYRQVRMMNHLLADLLDVVRIAQNKIQLQLELFDLRQLFPVVQELMAADLEKYNCSLFIQSPDYPVEILGDQTRFTQILVNLIQNAAKYSGTPDPINVLLEYQGDQVHVAIIDHGRGIPSEQLESIFEPFTQLEQDRHRSDGGLGIGLSLTKLIVELHQGRVFAKSDGPGKGTVFHLWFPRCSSKSNEIGDHSEPPRLEGQSKTEEQSKILPKVTPCPNPLAVGSGSSSLQQSLKIAIVEDIAESREMLRILLELEGHSVVTAESGRQALDVLEHELPDLALVDIGLPDISGYEVARHTRSSGITAKLFLVALTGYGQSSDIAKAIQSGFDQHLVKPVMREQLSIIIEAARRQKAAD